MILLVMKLAVGVKQMILNVYKKNSNGKMKWLDLMLAMNNVMVMTIVK